MEKAYRIKVDIKKNNGMYAGLVQYDNISNILYINLTEGIKILEIKDYEEIYCLVLKPNMEAIKLNCEVSDDKKQLKVVLTDGVLSHNGILQCEIKIRNKDYLMTSGSFYLRVRKALGTGGETYVSNPFLVGKDGKDGKDGHTPVVGIDFFTEEDKQEMIERIGHMSVNRIDEADISKLF